MQFSKLIYAGLLLATFFLFGQFQCFGPCEESYPVEYHNFNYTIFALNNQGPTPLVAIDNKAPMQAFGLRIQYNTHAVDSLSLYFDPECNTPTPDSAITQVWVSCLQKFDATHAAGNVLNDYFRVRLPKATWDLPAYRTLNLGLAAFNTFADTTRADVVLVNPPAQTGVYQFKVALVRSSLDTIFLVTKPITLYN
jgi:hypothetical protein